MTEAQAEVEIVTADFAAALEKLRGRGLRLDVIWPAEDPHTALLSDGGQRVRLTSRPGAPRPPVALPAFHPEFTFSRTGPEGGEGRAGMLYRDLIPGRLGGHVIASHIAIPEGGPVADWVHYHLVALQLIAVRRGWVRVVYEDQGEPFVMAAGDLVLQPPGIRHRVLEAAPGLEVVELTCPAVHETIADHDMTLPNGPPSLGRAYGGQSFLHHKAATAPWIPWHGGEAQATGLGQATNGRAGARFLRPGAADAVAAPPHDGELAFGFVLDGSARLAVGEGHRLGPADAFTLKPDVAWGLSAMSPDFRLLHVTTRAHCADPVSPA